MTLVFLPAALISAIWSFGAITLTAMPLYPWLTAGFRAIWFCSSGLPVGGILMSTCTPDSFSYLCTPAAAIFQNSLALLVTKASLSCDLPPAGAVAAVSEREHQGCGDKPPREPCRTSSVISS